MKREFFANNQVKNNLITQYGSFGQQFMSEAHCTCVDGAGTPYPEKYC